MGELNYLADFINSKFLAIFFIAFIAKTGELRITKKKEVRYAYFRSDRVNNYSGNRICAFWSKAVAGTRRRYWKGYKKFQEIRVRA
ncbi:MAG: hypothetical protein DDT19_00569 [Syntrophomonadaceae bacterium]|nr:hypothetical protein [Bacillota bacterium]